MYTKQEQEHVYRMRERFFSQGSADGITGVRPEILAAWTKSYAQGLSPRDPIQASMITIPHTQLMEVIGRQRLLYSVALPYMQKLFDFLKEEHFFVSLFGADGYVLKIIGKENTFTPSGQSRLHEGSWRGADCPAANLLSLCLQKRAPVQIFGAEHTFEENDSWAGAASPIFDYMSEKILGGIGIHGLLTETHHHTLGLSCMTAQAISREMELYRLNEDLSLYSQKINNALESAEVGIVYLDADFRIKHINQKAIRQLRIGAKNADGAIGRDFLSFLPSGLTPGMIKGIIREQKLFETDFIPDSRGHAVICSFTAFSSQYEEEYAVNIVNASEVHRKAGQIIGSRAVFTFDDILGESDVMRQVKRSAKIMSGYDSTILITGESGTGKELVAQAIHNSGIRANKPFVAVNCGAIPKSLIESELFGYEAGSYTGASKMGNAGKFELANGGTILLDEIGEMPYDMQTSLLRVLQSKEVTRIGGKRAIPVDVMVIAATNRDLRPEIQNQTFRNDLFYRLNMFSIHLPPLAQRGIDIILLARFFLDKYREKFRKNPVSLSQQVTDVLMAYSWPGNVRELENVIARAVIVCEKEMISLSDLPTQMLEEVRAGSESRVPPSPAFPVPSPPAPETVRPGDTFSPFHNYPEAVLLRETIIRHNGNLSSAAKALHMSRPTLYRKLDKYQLRPTLQNKKGGGT